MTFARKPLASLEGVNVHFGKRTILQDVSLELLAGDFCALIGPNGAGKSTLLGLFNGFTPLSCGKVIFKNEEVNEKTVSRLRLKIAHVFQIIDIDPKIPVNVFETVLAGTYGKLGLFKRPGHVEKAKALEALRHVGLAGLKDRSLGQLSGGERQRVAIARALAQDPDLLLLDEPTAALDWQAQREILALVQGLQRSYAITVLMATHDLNAVSTVASKVTMLKQGRLMWAGHINEAMEPVRLSQLYDVPITIYEYNQRRVALF